MNNVIDLRMISEITSLTFNLLIVNQPKVCRPTKAHFNSPKTAQLGGKLPNLATLTVTITDPMTAGRSVITNKAVQPKIVKTHRALLFPEMPRKDGEHTL